MSARIYKFKEEFNCWAIIDSTQYRRGDKALQTHTAAGQDGTRNNIGNQLVYIGSTTTMSIEPRSTQYKFKAI